eukprot:Sspe_Gene.59159::Locus_32484_Transcript_1_1_Confidence_1.000_Length_3142::g.59159::m.59159
MTRRPLVLLPLLLWLPSGSAEEMNLIEGIDCFTCLFVGVISGVYGLLAVSCGAYDFRRDALRLKELASQIRSSHEHSVDYCADCVFLRLPVKGSPTGRMDFAFLSHLWVAPFVRTPLQTMTRMRALTLTFMVPVVTMGLATLAVWDNEPDDRVDRKWQREDLEECVWVSVVGAAVAFILTTPLGHVFAHAEGEGERWYRGSAHISCVANAEYHDPPPMRLGGWTAKVAWGVSLLVIGASVAVAVVCTSEWNSRRQEARLLGAAFGGSVVHFLLEAGRCAVWYAARAPRDESLPPDKDTKVDKDSTDRPLIVLGRNEVFAPRPVGDEPLGILLDGMVLENVSPRGPCAAGGAYRFIGRRLTHVNRKPVHSLYEVGEMTKERGPVVLTFDEDDDPLPTTSVSRGVGERAMPLDMPLEFLPSEPPPEPTVGPPVVVKGAGHPPDGTRGYLHHMGGRLSPTMITVLFAPPHGPLPMHPDHLVLTTADQEPNCYANLLAEALNPEIREGSLGTITGFYKDKVLVRFPYLSAPALLPASHLDLKLTNIPTFDTPPSSPVSTRLRDLPRAVSRRRPRTPEHFYLPAYRTVPPFISDIVDNIHLERDGERLVVVGPNKESRFQNNPPSRREAVPQLARDGGALSQQQYRQCLSQFYAIFNPSQLHLVDELVQRTYGLQGGPKELLGRLSLAYPSASAVGALDWLLHHTNATETVEAPTIPRLYTVHSPGETGAQGTFTLESNNVSEGRPVWSMRNYQMLSVGGVWKVQKDGVPCLTACTPHRGCLPHEVMLWGYSSSGAYPRPDPSITVHIAPRKALFPDPSVPKPCLKTLPPPVPETPHLPERTADVVKFIPTAGVYEGREVTFTVHGAGEARSLQFAVDGATVARMTRRIALVRDHHGLSLQFPEADLTVALPDQENLPYLLGGMRHLAREAGLVHDLDAEWARVRLSAGSIAAAVANELESPLQPSLSAPGGSGRASTATRDGSDMGRTAPVGFTLPPPPLHSSHNEAAPVTPQLTSPTQSVQQSEGLSVRGGA